MSTAETSPSPVEPEAERIVVLDGLRGAAVLMVMIYHTTLDAHYCNFGRAATLVEKILGAGNIGVDLFFVLSGFLITGILLASKQQPLLRYLKNFYARRALRIFPLYYATLTITLLLIKPLLDASNLQLSQAIFQSPGSYTSWLWIYGTNLAMTISGKWLYGNLDHFWSLAVEEHFYLVWPILAYALPVPVLNFSCLLLCVGALACRTYFMLVVKSNIAQYILSPCRMDQLAIGALLAVRAAATPESPPGDRDKVCKLILLSSAIALGYGLFFNVKVYAMGPLANKFAYACELCLPLISGIFFASVIRLALNGSCLPLKQLLSSRLLLIFGRYSYGLYIIHHLLRLPNELLPRVFSPDTKGLCMFALYAALTWSVAFVLAAASFEFFEKKCLRLKGFFPLSPVKSD